MRVAVLPRDVAANVNCAGISRGMWVVNVVNLVVTAVILAESMVDRGLSASMAGPFALLGVMLVLALWGIWKPRVWLAGIFLAIGAVCATFYEVMLLAAYPGFLDDGFFVVNRPAVSLVLIGVVTSTWLAGLMWIFAGFIVSTAVSVTVAVLTGLPLTTGWGPMMVLTIYGAIFIVLGANGRSQRRSVPDFEALEGETRQLLVEENLRSRLTAGVHDTLLNDLSLVMNAPDVLDKRAVDRLRVDIDTLTSAEWLRETQSTIVDGPDAELRNRLMMMVSDLQWRGLSIHITGSGQGIIRTSPESATALLEATRACLENVLRHSGTTVAEIDMGYTASDLTVVVSDQGAGFDPVSVAADRMGVRLSVIERMHAVGGTARIWSSPGTGTSIVLSAPVLEVVTDHPEFEHGQR